MEDAEYRQLTYQLAQAKSLIGELVLSNNTLAAQLSMKDREIASMRSALQAESEAKKEPSRPSKPSARSRKES